MFILQRHKERVVLQPVLFRRTKAEKVLPPLLQKPAARFAQHRIARLIQQAVVHPGRVVSPGKPLIFRPLQQALPRQHVQVDKIGVSGKGGKGLIGRVPKAGWTDGQQLPAALSSLCQKVHEGPRLHPHGTDPIRGGQGGYRHQNTSSSHVDITFSSLLGSRNSHLRSPALLCQSCATLSPEMSWNGTSSWMGGRSLSMRRSKVSTPRLANRWVSCWTVVSLGMKYCPVTIPS